MEKMACCRSKTTTTNSVPSSKTLKLCFLPCFSTAPTHPLSPYAPASPPPPPPPSHPPAHPVSKKYKRERRIVSLESGRLLTLTADDLEVISTLWAKIPNKHLWCQRLFLKIFSLKPSMTAVMHYDGLPVKQVMQNPRFLDHCNNFVEFWDLIITTLAKNQGDTKKCDSRRKSLFESDEEEDKNQNNISFVTNAQVIGRIRQIGQLHSGMPGVTFDAESWLLFKNVLLESVCGQRRASLLSQDQDKSWLSWCKLVTFVVSEMKDAFNESIRKGSNTE